MQCPKCGNENPDDARVCASCSFISTDPRHRRSKPRARTGKTVVGATLLAGLSLILAVCVKPTLAFLAAVVGLIAIVVSIVQTVRGQKRLSVRRIAIGAFILLEMILLTYWRIDAAPLSNDYSIYDLRSDYSIYDLRSDLRSDYSIYDLRSAPIHLQSDCPGKTGRIWKRSTISSKKRTCSQFRSNLRRTWTKFCRCGKTPRKEGAF